MLIIWKKSDRNSDVRYGGKSQNTEESIDSYMVTKLKMLCATSDEQLAKFKKIE